MDLYGIGFSNIKLSSKDNDYLYKYDYRINTFPEEVFMHEFLHTLERTAKEYGYNIPELHNYANYGYKEERLSGLKDWYEDYMNGNILDKINNTYIGLNEQVYKEKPAHKENFNFTVEVKFNKEPKNLLEEIKGLFSVIFTQFNMKGNTI